MAYRSFENDSFWSNSVPYLYDYYVYNQEKAKAEFAKAKEAIHDIEEYTKDN